MFRLLKHSGEDIQTPTLLGGTTPCAPPPLVTALLCIHLH